MKTILVTGARGFIGKNLCIALKRLPGINVIEYDLDSNKSILEENIGRADIVYHLAGINRPKDPKEFIEGNFGFTQHLLNLIKKTNSRPKVIVTSSIQAELDNPYGKSKLMVEEELYKASKEIDLPVYVYRLNNVFGKWCKPFYNSVISTFCYQVSHNDKLIIDDPNKYISFIYIDDIIDSFLLHLSSKLEVSAHHALSIEPVYTKSLQEIADLIESFRASRSTYMLPDISDPFVKKLYSTYLSYLEQPDFIYAAEKKSDNRGYLYELIKTKASGQIFVSRTLPGITRGNHYHDSKVEKFCVLDGTALISFRHIVTNEYISFEVRGTECKIVDIPPGYTHSIKNIGESDLITLFWANGVFDKAKPDTYALEV